MTEKSFQRKCASLIKRRDAAMRASDKIKHAYDDEEMDFLMSLNDDQADRYEKLVELHIRNVRDAGGVGL